MKLLKKIFRWLFIKKKRIGIKPVRKDPNFIVTSIRLVKDVDSGMLFREWKYGLSGVNFDTNLSISIDYKEIRWGISAFFIIGGKEFLYKTIVCFRVSDYKNVVVELPVQNGIKIYSIPRCLYCKTLDSAIDITRGILASKGLDIMGEAKMVLPNPHYWDTGDAKEWVKIGATKK